MMSESAGKQTAGSVRSNYLHAKQEMGRQVQAEVAAKGTKMSNDCSLADPQEAHQVLPHPEMTPISCPLPSPLPGCPHLKLGPFATRTAPTVQDSCAAMNFCSSSEAGLNFNEYRSAVPCA